MCEQEKEVEKTTKNEKYIGGGMKTYAWEENFIDKLISWKECNWSSGLYIEVLTGPQH